MENLAARFFALLRIVLVAAGAQQLANSQTTVNTTVPTSTRPHTNRLSHEKSPYLLQHQHNPVDWYPWGNEAFNKARAENKPIFLSIGYSTCHWCHVMERESFENETIANFLNQYFVSIKVDREERPDVDKIYMTFVQATAGQGGWPLNVVLTPELRPFFGGTYFPPDNRYGRTSFIGILQQVQKLWESQHGDITNSAEQIHAHLRAAAQSAEGTNALLTAETIRRAGSLLKETYDPRHGGFGSAPKFPQPSQPQLLLRYAKRFHDEDARRMVLTTCEKMAAGGIHDQLGGGFARYSVDAQWLVPHFEKMLYDNAQLVHLYLDAYLASGDKRHAEVARDILDYVLRDMTNHSGGFYSAEDADSEGHEGKFYCWTREELSRLLSPEELKEVVRYFGITEQGNFSDHSHPSPLPNQNVLSIAASELNPSQRSLLDSAKQKMLKARSQRSRPHLDDKTLASWNGLMLGAMARASVILDEENYRRAAEKNLEFLHSRLWDDQSHTLYHRWRDNERDQVQLLEGYAFLLSGVVELYEATLRPKYLEFAIELASAMLVRFYDSDSGGFWQSGKEAKDLILRIKEDYDGAEPSGNSVAILALLKLGKITGRTEFSAAAEKSLRHFSSRLEQLPQAMPYMLQALDFILDEPHRAVVAGDATRPEIQNLLHAIHNVYQPNKVVLGTDGPVEPFAKSLPAEKSSLVYVCTGNACRPPTVDAASIRDWLN